MNSDFEKYVCINCGGLLRFSENVHQTDGEVCYGKLACQACGMHYPNIRGIPRFIPTENNADSFGYQWNIHRETQLDNYTGLPISKDRLFALTIFELWRREYNVS